jgi:hypothetical protein
MSAIAIIHVAFIFADTRLGQDSQRIYHDAWKEEHDLHPGLRDEEQAYGQTRMREAMLGNRKFAQQISAVDRDRLQVQAALRGGTSDPLSLQQVSAAQGKEIDDGELAQQDYRNILQDMQRARTQIQSRSNTGPVVAAVSLLGFVGVYFLNGGWRPA